MDKTRKIRLILPMLLLCALFLVCGSPSARAEDTAADNAVCSLALTLKAEGESVPGVRVRIYRAADYGTDTAEYSLAGSFAGLPVELNGLTAASQWDAAADTLAAYAAADGITPDAGLTADGSGLAFFSGLKPGLYLAVAESLSRDGWTWTFQNSLLLLPAFGPDGSLTYDVTASPKPARTPTDAEAEYRVVKHWMDDGHADERPQNVTVAIYQDGALYDTVVLSDENNWSCSWKGSTGSSWRAVERNIAGAYTVTVTQSGTVFTVTNRYGATIDIPNPKIPTGPLPDTGQLWWPVPLLAGSGILLFAAGWLLSRKRGPR